MKRTAVVIVLLLAMCLGGCSAMLEKDYTVVKPHNEQYVADEESDVLTVENFAGLKNAILSFVEAGMEYGVIRVSNYDGDVTQDVATAAYEVARNDPLGAFAIDYLTHDYTRIVSYYELHIYITYRRTTEDIASIIRVSGDADLRDKLKELLADFGQKAIFRFSYYSDTDYDALIKDICSEDPLLEFGNPKVSVSLYPETGVQRIAELTVAYGTDIAELKEMKKRLESAAQSAEDSILPSVTEALRAFRLYKTLTNNTKFDTEAFDIINDGSGESAGLSATAYGALVSKLAVPEGYAKAYYLLCDLAGIDCTIVHGRRNGYDHVWNIIKIDDNYYHVDCGGAVMDEGFQGFLLTDAAMEGYRWSDELYPVCDGTLTYYDVVPGARQASEETSAQPVFSEADVPTEAAAESGEPAAASEAEAETTESTQSEPIVSE